MPFHIQQITAEAELAEFGRIAASAYPGFGGSPAEVAQRVIDLEREEATTSFWGCYENGRLVGGMRILDFSLNYCGHFIKAGGLGFVAVGLPDKKRGVARELVHYFLVRCREEGAGLALLYPFRPDFYYRMGFGFGQKSEQYALDPAWLPHSRLPHAVRPLGESDLPLLDDCYHAFASSRHGYCRKTPRELLALLKHQGLYGYPYSGPLSGYVAFNFQRTHPNNALKNDLVVREWLWQTPEAFLGLSTFLRSQLDQVHRVVYCTQQADFHFISPDPRNDSGNLFNSHYHESNTGGVGLMYRITSLPLLIQAIGHRNFNDVDCELTLQVKDSFCPQQAGLYHLIFAGGQVRVGDQVGRGYQVAIDIAELSALLMGSVEFSSLYRLAKVSVEPSAVSLLTRLFWYEQRPECVTSF